MQVQDRTAGTDLWFVTDLETHKLDELAHDPHVNLGFYDVRDGRPDDPRLALILVEAHSAMYMKTNKPRPVVLFEVVKAIVTGQAPKVGEERIIGPREIERAQRIERQRSADR